MKEMKVNIWIVGIAVLLLLAGFQANAQRGRGHGSGQGYGDRTGKGNVEGFGAHNRMEAILDLTEEQQEQIEKLHLDLRKESLPTLNKIREKNAQLNTLITESADQSKINQLIDEISDLQATIRKESVNTHLKVRELLTDEQKVKFDTHFGNRFRVGGNHFQHSGLHGRDRK